MEIKVDDAALEAAATESMGKAMRDALDGWDVKRAVAQAITERLATDIMSQAVTQAIQTMETDLFIGGLARALSETVALTVQEMVRDTMLRMIASLRGIKDYESNYAARISALRAELFGDHAVQGADGGAT